MILHFWRAKLANNNHTGVKMSDYKNIIVKQENKAGVIQINRPDAMNALNSQMFIVVDEARKCLVQVHNGRRGNGAGTILHADGLIVTVSEVLSPLSSEGARQQNAEYSVPFHSRVSWTVARIARSNVMSSPVSCFGLDIMMPSALPRRKCLCAGFSRGKSVTLESGRRAAVHTRRPQTG